jgi:hypothetical protein
MILPFFSSEISAKESNINAEKKQENRRFSILIKKLAQRKDSGTKLN